RRAAGHRLEHRDAEALIQRRVRDAERTTVETREVRVADLAQPAHAVPADLDAAPAGGTDDAQLHVVASCGLDEAAEVLARLECAHGEDVLAFCGRTVARELVVDAVRDDTDLLVRDVQELAELPARELGDGDDTPGCGKHT